MFVCLFDVMLKSDICGYNFKLKSQLFKIASTSNKQIKMTTKKFSKLNKSDYVINDGY